jgi:hypothetical protein
MWRRRRRRRRRSVDAGADSHVDGKSDSDRHWSDKPAYVDEHRRNRLHSISRVVRRTERLRVGDGGSIDRHYSVCTLVHRRRWYDLANCDCYGGSASHGDVVCESRIGSHQPDKHTDLVEHRRHGVYCCRRVERKQGYEGRRIQRTAECRHDIYVDLHRRWRIGFRIGRRRSHVSASWNSRCERTNYI